MKILFSVPGAVAFAFRLFLVALVLGVVVGYQLAGALAGPVTHPGPTGTAHQLAGND
jgi:hypothetical protein